MWILLSHKRNDLQAFKSLQLAWALLSNLATMDLKWMGSMTIKSSGLGRQERMQEKKSKSSAVFAEIKREGKNR